MLASADRHYATTRALAERAAREARKGDVGRVVVRHQAAAASTVTAALSAMLAEQNTPVPAEAALAPLAFTASPEAVTEMADNIQADWQLDRMVMGLVADAARGAESVSIVTRPRVGYVRYVNPPCCSRCAILAGRFYRWSSGFDRHPGCDCTHLPTTDPRSEFRQNPHDLVDQGLVTGLSKADRRALADGANLNQLVNAKRGGLRRVNFGPGRTVTTTTEGTTARGIAGKSLGDLSKVEGSRYRVSQRMRLTPDSIYRVADGDRDTAMRLLKLHGYIT
jgi:hypothetical protein